MKKSSDLMGWVCKRSGLLAKISPHFEAVLSPVSVLSHKYHPVQCEKRKAETHVISLLCRIDFAWHGAT